MFPLLGLFASLTFGNKSLPTLRSIPFPQPPAVVHPFSQPEWPWLWLVAELFADILSWFSLNWQAWESSRKRSARWDSFTDVSDVMYVIHNFGGADGRGSFSYRRSSPRWQICGVITCSDRARGWLKWSKPILTESLNRSVHSVS